MSNEFKHDPLYPAQNPMKEYESFGSRLAEELLVKDRSASPAPSKPEGVTIYVTDSMWPWDGSGGQGPRAKRVVLASSYDAKCAEVERLKAREQSKADLQKRITELTERNATLRSQLAEAQRAKLDWSLARRILEQGMAIQCDYDHGKYPSYEHLSARLDEAARERIDALTGREGT